MKRPFIISGTGCALVDYLYKPVCFTDEVFGRFLSQQPGDGGLTPGKLVFTEEFEKFSKAPYLQTRGLITKGKEPVALNIGGPSIVSLIHAAQLLHGTDAEVYFYGSKGNDNGGRFIDEKLKATPLNVGQYKTGSLYTPFTDVLSDPDYDGGHGERIFINNIGAAWEFLPGDLDDKFFMSNMVVFGGTALVPNIHNALEELLERAKNNQAITVVNTVYDFLNEKNNPSQRWPVGKSINAYKKIDLLIADMEEAYRLSGTSNAGAAMEFFKSTGVGSVIITHGSKPVHFFARNDLFGDIPVSQLPVSARVIAELSGEVQRSGDTTGCGDNFVGGVIASLAVQLMEPDCCRVNLHKAVALALCQEVLPVFTTEALITKIIMVRKPKK
ncbi:MAG: carbohydrate kinase family protein [Bacteroidales bacterium]|nr:carbohydrate kinase family protein [Bacteroidales bacterium]